MKATNGYKEEHEYIHDLIIEKKWQSPKLIETPNDMIITVENLEKILKDPKTQDVLAYGFSYSLSNVYIKRILVHNNDVIVVLTNIESNRFLEEKKHTFCVEKIYFSEGNRETVVGIANYIHRKIYPYVKR